MLAVDLITVPYDSGRRGYRMGAGPQALLRAGLVQTLRAAGYDTELVPVESAGTLTTEIDVAFELADRIARVTRSSRAAGRFPLTVSGNCFGTVGALAGVSADSPALVWFDAHGDLNTPETSPGGFLDGMPAAIVVGWTHVDRTAKLEGFSKLNESDLLMVGVRDLDPGEAAAIERSSVRVLPPAQARNAEVVRSVCDAFAGRSVYLHLDVDVFDPDQVGAANSYASPDGLGLEDVLTIIREIGERSTISGMTVSSYDPAVDTDGVVARAALDVIRETLCER